MSKIRKFSLSENTSSPVYGIGILTDEPGYKLCWLLNQHFPWNLVKSEDILVAGKESPITQTYSGFESTASLHPSVKLIGNRSKEGQWLTIFRQVDFLLYIPAAGQDTGYLENLKTSIATKVPQIRGLFKVPLPSFCYL